MCSEKLTIFSGVGELYISFSVSASIVSSR